MPRRQAPAAVIAPAIDLPVTPRRGEYNVAVPNAPQKAEEIMQREHRDNDPVRRALVF